MHNSSAMVPFISKLCDAVWIAHVEAFCTSKAIPQHVCQEFYCKQQLKAML